MKSALSASLKAEDEAVRSRFEKAESLFGDRLAPAEPSPLDPAIETSPQEIPKKDKVIRDSFTLPLEDYGLVSTIRDRCLKLSTNVNKSEVVRAGLHALTQMEDDLLLDIINSLSKVKTGRPSKSQRKG